MTRLPRSMSRLWYRWSKSCRSDWDVSDAWFTVSNGFELAHYDARVGDLWAGQNLECTWYGWRLGPGSVGLVIAQLCAGIWRVWRGWVVHFNSHFFVSLFSISDFCCKILVCWCKKTVYCLSLQSSADRSADFLLVSLVFLELFSFYQLVRDSSRHGSFLFQLFMTNELVVDVAKFI